MAIKRERGSSKTKGRCKIAIDEDMNIYVIEGIKDELSKQLVDYNHFTLNLGSVEEFDSAGIQLLLALKKELLSKNKTLEFSAFSESVTRLVETYGLGDQLYVGNQS